jgi:hypothetical protein
MSAFVPTEPVLVHDREPSYLGLSPAFRCTHEATARQIALGGVMGFDGLLFDGWNKDST